MVLGSGPLAAVGSTNSVYSLIIGFLQGLTNGFAIIVAQSYGAGDRKQLKGGGAFIEPGYRNLALSHLYGFSFFEAAFNSLKYANSNPGRSLLIYLHSICRNDGAYAL